MRVLVTLHHQRLALDLLASRQDLLDPPDVDIRRRHVVRWPVVALVVVVLDKAADLLLQGPRDRVVLQLDQVLPCTSTDLPPKNWSGLFERASPGPS